MSRIIYSFHQERTLLVLLCKVKKPETPSLNWSVATSQHSFCCFGPIIQTQAKNGHTTCCVSTLCLPVHFQTAFSRNTILFSKSKSAENLMQCSCTVDSTQDLNFRLGIKSKVPLTTLIKIAT